MDGADHFGAVQLIGGQRESQPLGHVTRCQDPFFPIAVEAAADEKFGAEATVPILEVKGVLVVLCQIPLGSRKGTAQLRVALPALPHPVGQTEEPMGASASGSIDGLANLFRHHPLDIPAATPLASPDLIDIQVMRQPDQFKGQFGAGPAGGHFTADQVFHRQVAALDLHGIIDIDP